MKEVHEIQKEIQQTVQNIRVAEASIKVHDKKIKSEIRQILQLKSWQSALEWTLDED
jgi:hypothetical protein